MFSAYRALSVASRFTSNASRRRENCFRMPGASWSHLNMLCICASKASILSFVLAIVFLNKLSHTILLAEATVPWATAALIPPDTRWPLMAQRKPCVALDLPLARRVRQQISTIYSNQCTKKKDAIHAQGQPITYDRSFDCFVVSLRRSNAVAQKQDGPDILVCDEAHMIKNTRADITQALKQVKSQRRIALTGSPLQNNLMEYYCVRILQGSTCLFYSPFSLCFYDDYAECYVVQMVDFVREGFLGSSQEFRNRFQNPIANGQHTNSTSDDVKIMNQRSHILYEQLKGFVQRMDMNVVKKDLPPKTVFVIAVKLSPLQRKLYKKFLDVHGFTNDTVSKEKIRKSFFAGYQALAQFLDFLKQTFLRIAINATVFVVRLKVELPIWNHPGILELMKENRDCGKREDAVENFLADDSSSEDNIDENMINGGKDGSELVLLFITERS
ncbi:hypothetical protein RJ640_016205 [Escallonia rubra]|uniref:SNF2 N-terminal domain-containing protein n=1 Tax=Escallonia rubra TaxID=112253 RepID=A0AA88QKG6_9ASTE|nr:hypothetical protein RJ640_016205 [Escallonia rubra]